MNSIVWLRCMIDEQGGSPNKDVEYGRDICCRIHVVETQEVEARQQTTGERSDDVGRIEESKPGHATTGCANPARDDRQRCTHQERGRHETDPAKQRSKEDSAGPIAAERRVEPAGVRHQVQVKQCKDRDTKFNQGINAQRAVTT